MSLTIQQLLNDAKRLTSRLREHDASADNVISSTTSVLKDIEAMRQYQEDIDCLNSIAHNRPRAQLVLGIQQENRHIRQLQHENKELRAALEEHQNAIELIMSKYREHMACLLNSTKVDKNFMNQQKTVLLQERADKICEMAGVMQRSMQIDEENQAREQELMSRLITENKGLREMLEISFRNGSYTDPLVGPKMVTRSCQTEQPPATTKNSNISTTLSPSATTTSIDKSSGIGKNSYGFSSSGRPLNDSDHENGRATSSLNGTASPTPISSSCESLRPLSSASEESEETSSTSDDDEIIFNTIKRQVKKNDLIFGGKMIEKNVENADSSSSSNNNQNCHEDENNDNNDDDVRAGRTSNGEDDDCDGERSAVKTETTKIESSKTDQKLLKSKNGSEEEDAAVVKVNGDSHLPDCLMDQQTEVLSQS